MQVYLDFSPGLGSSAPDFPLVPELALLLSLLKSPSLQLQPKGQGLPHTHHTHHSPPSQCYQVWQPSGLCCDGVALWAAHQHWILGIYGCWQVVVCFVWPWVLVSEAWAVIKQAGVFERAVVVFQMGSVVEMGACGQTGVCKWAAVVFQIGVAAF